MGSKKLSSVSSAVSLCASMLVISSDVGARQCLGSIDTGSPVLSDGFAFNLSNTRNNPSQIDSTNVATLRLALSSAGVGVTEKRGAPAVTEQAVFFSSGRNVVAMNRLSGCRYWSYTIPALNLYRGGDNAVRSSSIYYLNEGGAKPALILVYVENVQITMAEDFGVKGRGKFYDETGIIRDVIQNHLLQVVSYLAMEAPSSTYDEAIRDEQAKVLRTVRPMDIQSLVRGQFRGYRDEPGVARDSYMGTYAALRLWVDSWRWEGVPFFVRAGKCLAKTVTEVTIEFKNPPQVVFSEPTPSDGNTIRFRLSPVVAIALGARAKRPGEGMRGQPVELSIVESAEQGKGGRMEAYERLLGDAIAGDATLFARQDVVEAAWAIVDPVLHGPSPMFEYEPGSWGPPQADTLVADVGGWNTPS